MDQTTVQNVDPNTDMGTTKKSNGMKYGIIACAVLALGGIGFGVYGMTKKTEEKSAQDTTINVEMESQLTELKSKYSILQDYVKNLESTGAEVPEEAKHAANTESTIVNKNPILTTGNTDESYYRLYFQSPIYSGSVYDRKQSQVYISLVDGEIKNCEIFVENHSSDKCSINLLGGKIYKIVEVNKGQGVASSIVAFIMEDGSVEYFPLYEAFDTNNFNSRGKLKINGVVTDIITTAVNYYSAPGGYSVSLFIKKDGTFEPYDESMLPQPFSVNL